MVFMKMKNTKITIYIIIAIVIMTGCVDKENLDNGVEQNISDDGDKNISAGNNIISSSNDKMLERYSLEKLILESDRIIIGRVINIMPSKWNTIDGKKDDSRGSIIYTDVNIKVGEYLKGGGDFDKKTVTVRILGGTVEQDIQNVEDQPRYYDNERVLVFLKNDKDVRTKDIGIDHFTTVGLIQGKIPILQKDEVFFDGKKMLLKDIKDMILKTK